MVMIDILAGGVCDNTTSLIKRVIIAYAVTICNNSHNGTDNSINQNGGALIHTVKLYVKNLDMYDIYMIELYLAYYESKYNLLKFCMIQLIRIMIITMGIIIVHKINLM